MKMLLAEDRRGQRLRKLLKLTAKFRERIALVYRVGAVGLKPGSGEQYLYSHNDEPVINTIVIGEASRVRIHPMLHMAMGIDLRRGG